MTDSRFKADFIEITNGSYKMMKPKKIRVLN